MQEYLMIGEVLKPQGVRGECKIKPYCADVELFHTWHTLYRKEREAYTPLSCRVVRIHEGFVYAVLGRCASADDAEKLRGCELYIDRAHASPLEEDATYIADLIGCEAVDEAGHVLGTLREVLQHGTVDTWVFHTPTGTLMAPALKAVFPEVNIRERRISVVSEKLAEVSVVED